MRNKLFIYPFIFLFLAFTNLPLLKLNSSHEYTDEKLDVEYLNQFPENDYIIGPGDTLSIVISKDLGLFSDATIDGEGTIYLPKLKRIYVDGLSINELNSLLNKAYLKFIKYPNIETTIKRYRPIRVFVDGEVVYPGNKKMVGFYSSNLEDDNFDNQKDADDFLISPNKSISNVEYFFPTVFDAIRASGGITRYSNLKNIRVIRKNSITEGGGKKETTLNFEDLLTIGDGNHQNIRIYDSDIIKIQKSAEPNDINLSRAILSDLNPKFIRVFVTGRVNSPGKVIISRASVLSDAIDVAGGARVMRGPVTFIRFLPNGSIDKRKFKLTKNKRGQFKNPNLMDGDLIVVGENILTATNEVIKEVTNPFVGIFSTYGLIKAISD